MKVTATEIIMIEEYYSSGDYLPMYDLLHKIENAECMDSLLEFFNNKNDYSKLSAEDKLNLLFIYYEMKKTIDNSNKMY